jgi:uncharacterized cupredoxin-like copper-binding protein
MKTRRALALGGALLATSVVAAACGDDSSTSAGSSSDGRIIEMTMTDMAYSPDTIAVSKGETVTFRFHNNGQAIHEAVIGDEGFQMEHGASMTDSTMDGMGHDGMGSDDTVTVEPGMTGEMTYRFDESGTMLIGCHQPGHYEAGMKATITVS